MVSQRAKGIMSVSGSFCFHFMIGSLYTWSAINPYFTSYLKLNGNPNIEQLDVFFIMPVILFLQYVLLPIGNKIGDLVGARIVTAIGAACLFLSYILIKVYQNYAFVMFAIVIFGMGDSLAFIYVIKNGWKYFPDKAGLVSGIILAGLGLSSAILNPISDFLIINPDQVKPGSDGFYNKEICDNFDTYLIFVIVLYAILAIVAIALTSTYTPEETPTSGIVKDNNDNHSVEEINNDNVDSPDNNNKGSIKNNECIHVVNSPSNEPIIISKAKSKTTENNDKQNKEEIQSKVEQGNKDSANFRLAMKSKKNILLFIISFIAPFFCILLTNTNRAFGNLNNLSQGGLQIMSFILAFLNGVTRFVWGWLVDKFSFKILMAIVLFIQLAISISVYFAAQNLYAFIIVNFLIGMCTAGVFTLLPPTFNKIFGVKNGAKMFSYAGIFIGIASVLGPILTKLVIKEKKDYLIVYLISAGLLVIAIILLFFLNEELFEYSDNKNEIQTAGSGHQIKDAEVLLNQNDNLKDADKQDQHSNRLQNQIESNKIVNDKLTLLPSSY